MSKPTESQWRVLDVLSRGRGRHAPMAYHIERDTVTVYRAGREVTAFALGDVLACVERYLVVREACSRYRITPYGRAFRKEHR